MLYEVITLVFDLSNDFLKQVFDGYDAGAAAVFVDDDGHVQAPLLKFLEKIVRFFVGRHVIRRTNQVGDGRVVHRLIEQVEGVDDADEVVRVFMINRQPRETSYNFV